ncbi:MAG: hypothetical protein J2P37_00280 [Ktedonobacteraceae bacterium]|nr:hypothetical protein [Ktedonobacteraceae bacterium]
MEFLKKLFGLSDNEEPDEEADREHWRQVYQRGYERLARIEHANRIQAQQDAERMERARQIVREQYGE